MHCSAGKDRTGILCALILLLAGVPDEAVADEYALTTHGLAEMKEEIVERILKNEALKGNREGAERMLGSKRETMMASIEMIEREYGGAEGYVRVKCGMGEGDLNVIRENMTKKD